ncbi:Transcriptional repressor NrdR [Bienertia sinuspersici]
MDTLDAVGINKSLKIRVNVDVTKPLQNYVSIRMKQGVMEFPIKYEKLPVFCYVYGLLGHRENDCDNGQVTRRFSEKLRVSTPWKATKVNDIFDDGAESSARKLFVTKKPVTPEEVNKSIGEVANKLLGVSLSTIDKAKERCNHDSDGGSQTKGCGGAMEGGDSPPIRETKETTGSLEDNKSSCNSGSNAMSKKHTLLTFQ